jgi:hypothetical protein
MRASALAFAESLVMDWAVRSARSGSVAASASAMRASALAFAESLVMDRAVRSARSGSGNDVHGPSYLT